MNKKKIIVIVGLLLFIIIVGALSWYIFNGGSVSNEDAASTGNTTKSSSTSSKDIGTYIAGVDSLSKFNKLIMVSGVSDTLKLSGSNYIVLAPVDDAFKDLPAGYYDSLLTSDKKTSAIDISKYHYTIITNDQLTNGQKLKTAEGQEVVVGITDGKYSFTSAKGDKANASKAQKTSNGTLYIIDKVLLPQ